MGVPLMQCLAPLLSRVQHGIGGRTAVALFRSVFWYYKHHWDSELEQEIYKLVMALYSDMSLCGCATENSHLFIYYSYEFPRIVHLLLDLKNVWLIVKDVVI